MKQWFALCCVLLAPLSVWPQTLNPSEQSIKKAADDCMSSVSHGKADDAFSNLLSEYWKDKATSPQAIASMQRQYREVMQRVEDTMGKPVPGGYEFIGVKRLGTSVVKLVYLQKNELFFLPWSFSFYRANSEWRLTYISFPDVGSDDMKDFILSDPSNQNIKR